MHSLATASMSAAAFFHIYHHSTEAAASSSTYCLGDPCESGNSLQAANGAAFLVPGSESLGDTGDAHVCSGPWVWFVLARDRSPPHGGLCASFLVSGVGVSPLVPGFENVGAYLSDDSDRAPELSCPLVGDFGPEVLFAALVQTLGLDPLLYTLWLHPLPFRVR